MISPSRFLSIILVAIHHTLPARVVNHARFLSCPVKNIGKPDAGKLHVRFDEGGLGEACSLLYP